MATKSSFKRRIFVSLWILSSFFFVAIAQETDPTEVSALKAIRANLIDPRENLKSWKTGDPCRSKWAGVMCNPEVASDGYLHVRSLIFLNFNLSGQIAPEIGQLSHMDVLDFMWNNISGSIPKEIGKLSSLTLLLLNGNKLSGSLPEELGYLRNLDRFQIDENNISGTLPKSFANMTLVKHFHMNNNSISGQIPSEFYRLSHLVHLLLDNNNLSGYLPPEISQMPNLVILQLDNNNFSGTSIPLSYNNMTKLAKLSLRNCNLEGYMPDISRLVDLNFLDLSHNLLNGSIRADKVSPNITTIDLSNNMLDGTIPSSFTGFRLLQRISLQNNRFTGLVPSFIWQNNSFMANESVILNFENNSLTNISQVIDLPSNVTLMLQGNPLCENISNSKLQLCGSQIKYLDPRHEALNSSAGCKPQSCPSTAFYEYNPSSPIRCFCAAPIRVGYRLKSPGFSHFRPHLDLFVRYLTEDLSLFPHQLYIDSFSWEVGPRLRMQLKFFPESSSSFNVSEILRIKIMFAEWKIRNKDFFGPYELLNFTLLGVYSNVELESSSQLGKGTIIGIAVGAILGAVALVFIVSLTVIKRFNQQYRKLSRWHSALKPWLKIDGVKSFTYKEMVAATDSFSATHLVGQGGYGKVYKGILADGTCVAIKRTEEDSLQGFKEFLTEIEFLSRLHHKNLVSLLGFCCEKDEQMLVYEFMPNGTLRDHLSGRTGQSLSFSTRLQIALGAAKGVKYLHMEANPPVFHRDIKASNILLDAKFTSRVADFGLSRLALEPDNEGSSKGHISTMVKGTPGYLDPEYFLTHKLTDRSDVYSLGVVFLEMLTGMRPIIHGKNIVREAMVASQADMITSIVDKKMGMYPVDSVERFASLALRCCSNQTADRPSISEVVRELENICQLTAESIPDDSETWAPLPPRNDMSISSASSSSTKPIISQSFSPR